MKSRIVLIIQQPNHNTQITNIQTVRAKKGSTAKAVLPFGTPKRIRTAGLPLRRHGQSPFRGVLYPYYQYFAYFPPQGTMPCGDFCVFRSFYDSLQHRGTKQGAQNGAKSEAEYQSTLFPWSAGRFTIGLYDRNVGIVCFGWSTSAQIIMAAIHGADPTAARHKLVCTC